jgi:hypothetical protein
MQQNQVLLALFDPIFVSHHCVIVMSVEYPGPLFYRPLQRDAASHVALPIETASGPRSWLCLACDRLAVGDFPALAGVQSPVDPRLVQSRHILRVMARLTTGDDSCSHEEQWLRQTMSFSEAMIAALETS